MRIIDCPTEEMWADILMKPLQGVAYCKMRSKLMNCEVNYEEHKNNPTSSAGYSLTGREKWAVPFQTPQECVEQNRCSRLRQTADRPAAKDRRLVGEAHLIRRKATWPKKTTGNSLCKSGQ